jgi:hypothetical protein
LRPATYNLDAKPVYVNYLAINNVLDYSNMTLKRKFKCVQHSGISMHVVNLLDRSGENAKCFDEKEVGMVVLFEWTDDLAQQFGFLTTGNFQIF